MTRQIQVSRVSREDIRSLIRPSFTRALPEDEVRKLIENPVHGNGIISIKVALATRGATVEEVLQDSVSGSFVATAQGPGGVLIAMGRTSFDALDRLATLAVRPV